MWVEWNDNPAAIHTTDCTTRAIGVALDIPWEEAYTLLAVNGFAMGLVPLDSDWLWGSVLRQHGFRRYLSPDCPDCYTVREFCEEHPHGVYVLKVPSHVVTAVDGNYYDLFDSGDEPVIYYWTEEDY